MPVFGSKTSFAIETAATKPADLPARRGIVFGHICFWAAGLRVGDYEQSVVLGAPASMLGAKLAFQGGRKDDLVDGKSKEDALALIHAALYELESEGEEKTYAECIRLLERFEKFDICTNSSEAFDGIFAVLVDTNDGSRFIWQDYETRDVQEVSLAVGEYEDALRCFLNWYHLVEAAGQ